MNKTLHSQAELSIATPAFTEQGLGRALQLLSQNGSASYRAIADYLLRDQACMPALGIEELAGQCRVSTATISRFVRDLGFSSYSTMRHQLADTVQGLSQPVEKLRHTLRGKPSPVAAARASLQGAAVNVEMASQGLEELALQRIVAQLGKAATIYVMGFGLSAHLAGMLTLHLQPFCQHVVEVVGYGGTEVAAGHFANLGERDVLIVISFPRYALDAVRLAQFARSRSSTVIALTDSPASPLAPLAHHLLLAPSCHQVLPSSLSTGLAVIEALVSAMMLSSKKNVEKAARLTEAISAYLHDASVTEPQTARRRRAGQAQVAG